MTIAATETSDQRPSASLGDDVSPAYDVPPFHDVISQTDLAMTPAADLPSLSQEADSTISTQIPPASTSALSRLFDILSPSSNDSTPVIQDATPGHGGNETASDMPIADGNSTTSWLLANETLSSNLTDASHTWAGDNTTAVTPPFMNSSTISTTGETDVSSTSFQNLTTALDEDLYAISDTNTTYSNVTDSFPNNTAAYNTSLFDILTDSSSMPYINYTELDEATTNWNTSANYNMSLVDAVEEKAKGLTSMQIWFIITGFFIIMVLLLMLINCLIHHKSKIEKHVKNYTPPEQEEIQRVSRPPLFYLEDDVIDIQTHLFQRAFMRMRTQHDL